MVSYLGNALRRCCGSWLAPVADCVGRYAGSWSDRCFNVDDEQRSVGASCGGEGSASVVCRGRHVLVVPVLPLVVP